MKITPLNSPINHTLTRVSSDKSISHRCAIFSLLSRETSEVADYLEAGDTLNSLEIIKALGAKVEKMGEGHYLITPPAKIVSPNRVLECGNSGTAMRIFMGLLAASDGFFVLSGDEYLNERPMKRVAAPLASVGAKIYGREGANKAPLAIEGGKLSYFKFESQIASAQVKTALILAGLLGEGCSFSEPALSRDHSERMLRGMGAEISGEYSNLKVSPLKAPLKPLKMSVPNDPSSCFFFAVAAAITPGSNLKIQNILLNPTRIEAFKVLEKMGAKITYKRTSSDFDEVGEITVEGSNLNAVEVSENIAWLIDEAPALAIAFACANGVSRLRNAAELRVKESDRITVTVNALKKCGINARELEDGFEITGGEPRAAAIESMGDHRIAMSFAILGLKCGMEIRGGEFIATSFPRFSEILREIGASVED